MNPIGLYLGSLACVYVVWLCNNPFYAFCSGMLGYFTGFLIEFVLDKLLGKVDSVKP